MTMRSNAKIPNDIDRAAYAALHHVLRPEHHGLIDEWIKTAGESEKRGIIKLKKFAEPQLLSTVGRPVPGGHQPSTSNHNWHHAKSMRTGGAHPSGWPVRDHDDNGFMGRSASMPNMMGEGEASNCQFSWHRDDAAVRAQIAKPGGYVIQMQDTTEIMVKKNTQRNKGTYKLFGGTFMGTTTQAAVHNLRSLGLEPSH